MISVLTRMLGVENLDLAEDAVQDAYCRALEVWKSRGIPENPSAWLMTAAKNRAFDILRRRRTTRAFAPEVARYLDEDDAPERVEEVFDSSAFRDEQLSMMFSCCHPRLPEEAQIALVLNVLCGFGAAEIAAAFLVSRSAVEKRISRGKKVLAAAHTLFDLRRSDFVARLSAVHRALYLLFNEGYHGASRESAVRIELCVEAMRLVSLLRGYHPAASPATHALAALMYLHAARLPARLGPRGELIALAEQDRSRWDVRLVEEGLALLDQSATGDEVTTYHVEAAIAAVHAGARTIEETDWATIVSLYDRRMALAPSPIVALNRAIAVGRRDGAKAGLAALRAIGEPERLAGYPFYSAALGEAELRLGNPEAGQQHFRAALGRARNDEERRHLERRLRACVRSEKVGG